MSEKVDQTKAIDPSLLPEATPQAEQGRVGGFDALNEPGAIAETLELFYTDRLLARALDGPMVTRHGMDFVVVDSELELIAGEGGMKHVSQLCLSQAKTFAFTSRLDF